MLNVLEDALINIGIKKETLQYVKLGGWSQGNTDYKKAKERIAKGFLNHDEIDGWVNSGGWIGLWIPKGYILIDIDDDKTAKRIARKLADFKVMHIAIKTPHGCHFLFKDTGKVAKQFVKQITAGALIVDYRLADKGYTVCPTPNTENRKIIHANTTLDDMPDIFIPVRIYKQGTDDERELTPYIGEGTRDNSMYFYINRLGGWNDTYEHLNLSQLQFETIVFDVNNYLFEPPLEEKVVKEKLNRYFSDLKRKQPKKYKINNQRSNSTLNPETSGSDTTNEKTSQLNTLLAIAMNRDEGFDIYKNSTGGLFVWHQQQCLPLDSPDVYDILIREYYEATGNAAPPTETIKRVINTVRATSTTESETIPVVELKNRVAFKNGFIHYDIGDNTEIVITPDGWTQQQKKEPLFEYHDHQKPQCTPDKKGRITGIENFLRVNKEDRLLTLIYLISCFVPDIEHPVLHPSGSHGVGKTTFSKILNSLVDPTVSDIFIESKSDSVLHYLTNHYYCNFDNKSKISAELSDLICMACTGGTVDERQLYTNKGSAISPIKNCVVINGIEQLIRRSDLMDRTILINLEDIKSEDRKSSLKLWEEFNRQKPFFMGYIFSTLSKALKIYPTVKIEVPRLASFGEWGYAIAEAMKQGLGNVFLEKFAKNKKEQTEELVQNSTLLTTILQLLEKGQSVEGNTKQVFEQLYEEAGKPIKDSSFPYSFKRLIPMLKRDKATLLAKGIAWVEHGVGGRNKKLEIYKIGTEKSNSQTEKSKYQNICEVFDGEVQKS